MLLFELLILVLGGLKPVLLHQKSIPQSADQRHDDLAEEPSACEQRKYEEHKHHNDYGEVVLFELAWSEDLSRQLLRFVDETV